MFSNNKQELLDKIDNLKTSDNTNYNAGLTNVFKVMKNYVKEPDKDTITLFLTDGYPNEDTPNQIGTFEALKDEYPYMTINGIQYEMGKNIIKEIKEITDNQWVADQSNLENVLFDATICPDYYEDFIVTDYVHDDYFSINSVDDIKVSLGTVTVTDEDGLQKITWNLGKNAYKTGTKEQMKINLTLKPQYVGSLGLYPTNKKERVDYKLPEETSETVNSTLTPVLKNLYEVNYDYNAPKGCVLTNYPAETHYVYQTVIKNQEKPKCSGYLFDGWQIIDNDIGDIKLLNEDMFIMPAHDVTLRAIWSKPSIEKTMEGTINVKTTLYDVLKNAALEGTYAKKYTGAHQDAMDTNHPDREIYHFYASNDANGTAILEKNNVIFAGQCWQMIRTTDTGGVKLLYNGEAVNNQCLPTRGNHMGYSPVETVDLSTEYYYSTDYTYDSSSKRFALVNGHTPYDTNLTKYYTCLSTNASETCTKLYYTISLISNNTYYAIPLDNNANYSTIGTLEYNIEKHSPAYIGYMYNYTQDRKYIKPTGTIKYGKSFTYARSTGTYTLDEEGSINISDLDNNYNELSNAHYTCFNSTGICNQMYYVYYYSEQENGLLYYMDIISNQGIDELKNDFLNVGILNKKNSLIKEGVEQWYKSYLNNYDKYIEDTIFCNDRSQSNENENGWNPNGGNITTYMTFGGSTDLSCSNITDRFSISNYEAKLSYKVGLITARELRLLNNNAARVTGQEYWTMTPYQFYAALADVNRVRTDGVIGYYDVDRQFGVRPVISLIPEIEYSSGNGSTSNPYIVETN